jgi:hypothetical protein
LRIKAGAPEELAVPAPYTYLLSPYASLFKNNAEEY